MPSAFSDCLRIRYDVNLTDDGSGARFTRNLTTNRNWSAIYLTLRYIYDLS